MSLASFVYLIRAPDHKGACLIVLSPLYRPVAQSLRFVSQSSACCSCVVRSWFLFVLRCLFVCGSLLSCSTRRRSSGDAEWCRSRRGVEEGRYAEVDDDGGDKRGRARMGGDEEGCAAIFALDDYTCLLMTPELPTVTIVRVLDENRIRLPSSNTRSRR